jgi:hypothetical protein
MKDSPTKEAGSCPTIKSIPRHLWKPKSHYIEHKESGTGLYSGRDESSSHRVYDTF